VLLVPRPIRGLALLALLNAAADAAFLPLVPAVRDDLELSGVETGALLAATTLAALCCTLPVGALAARRGPRPLLLGAALLMPLALCVMATAPGLGVLLVGRVLFGLSFTVAWTVAPAAAAVRVPGARGTAALLAVAGLGWLVGPVGAGAAASACGWRVPLLGLAVLTLPAALPFLRGENERIVRRPVRLARLATLVRRSPAVAWAAVVSGLLGAVTGVIGILVPTLLAANGVGPAGVGAAVTASAVVWTAAATGAGRLARPRIGLPVLGATVAALAACWILPVVSRSTVVLVGFLVLAAACRAPLGALVYPLAARAVTGEAEATAVAGVLNVSWAGAALAAPLLAGLAAQQGLERMAFAVVCLGAGLVALGILASARRSVPAFEA
jgi:MFS family permease